MTSCYQSMTLNGMAVVIQEPVLCKKYVKQSWSDRFFTLPFKPFKRVKEVEYLTDVLKDGEIIRNGSTIFMNAKTWHNTRLALLHNQKL